MHCHFCNNKILNFFYTYMNLVNVVNSLLFLFLLLELKQQQQKNGMHEADETFSVWPIHNT